MENKSKVPVVLNLFTEKDDMIYVNIVSNGLTGQEWINKFESEGRNLSKEVKTVLNSKEFISTNGVVYNLVIVLGKHFQYGERTVSNVREFAYSKGFYKTRLEVACLLRDLLSDDKMRDIFLRALIIVSTHAGKEFTQILDFDVDEKNTSFQAHCVKDVMRWRVSSGFVFSTKKIKHQK